MTSRTTGLISELAPGQIFVFGSNEGGNHGRGAAEQAKLMFGARMGQGKGLMGRSYGIPTKSSKLRVLSVRAIEKYVQEFTVFARSRPDLHFLVTEVGCGLAGYEPDEIAPLFREASALHNVSLPAKFWAELGGAPQ